jgi:uncharacterized damage-inducible protein DinB
MKKYFIKLYQYNAWANDRVLGCLERQAVRDEKTLTLMSHLLVAQFLWLHRIEGLPKPPYELWQRYPLTKLRIMNTEIAHRWLTFIESQDSFERVLKYHNYTGDYFENQVEQIMIHLVNHCTYHRGQIALQLRQQGYEPINTDYITYDRVISGQWKD